jgi:hypothetical protein
LALRPWRFVAKLRGSNRDGLVAQLVEQCPFNSKPPILASFCHLCQVVAFIASAFTQAYYAMIRLELTLTDKD